MRRYKRSIKPKIKGVNYKKIINPLIQRANKKINSLIIRGYTKKSLAYKNLVSRLDNNKINFIDKNGKVKNFKNVDKLNYGQKRALRNSLDNFLESQTSTKTGVNKRLKNMRLGIDNLFKNSNVELTDKNLDVLMGFFQDKKFGEVANKIGGSDLLIITADSIERGYTKEEFLIDLGMYADLNPDLIDDVSDIYDKLINA